MCSRWYGLLWPAAASGRKARDCRRELISSARELDPGKTVWVLILALLVLL